MLFRAASYDALQVFRHSSARISHGENDHGAHGAAVIVLSIVMMVIGPEGPMGLAHVPSM